jgi:hypothetical protein
LSCYRSRVLSISILLTAGEEKAMKYEIAKPEYEA